MSDFIGESRSTYDERDEVRLSGRSGFAFLLAFGLAWSGAGILALVLPLQAAALGFIFQGAIGTPLAFLLEKLLGYPSVYKENSLNPLLILVAMSQLPGFLAAFIVYQLNPYYVPAVLAAVVGGHFLPYAWIHKSKVYVVMGAAVAVVPYALIAVLGETSFYFAGFVVGATLLACGFILEAGAESELKRRDHRP